MKPILIDLTGLEASEERDILEHPKLGGIIFLSVITNPQRNAKLVSQIHIHSNHQLSLTIDQQWWSHNVFKMGLLNFQHLVNIIPKPYASNPSC